MGDMRTGCLLGDLFLNPRDPSHCEPVSEAIGLFPWRRDLVDVAQILPCPRQRPLRISPPEVKCCAFLANQSGCLSNLLIFRFKAMRDMRQRVLADLL